MTLIKSMLLGSAAAIVAVAAAQAADLPTRKAAPVEYVKVCNVGGITGWILPGSDTCVKLVGLHHRPVRGRQPATPSTTGGVRHGGERAAGHGSAAADDSRLGSRIRGHRRLSRASAAAAPRSAVHIQRVLIAEQRHLPP